MKVAIINKTSSCVNFRWTMTDQNILEIEMTANNVTSVQLGSSGRATLEGDQTAFLVELVQR
jgi:hypothetical protein